MSEEAKARAVGGEVELNFLCRFLSGESSEKVCSGLPGQKRLVQANFKFIRMM